MNPDWAPVISMGHKSKSSVSQTSKESAMKRYSRSLERSARKKRLILEDIVVNHQQSDVKNVDPTASEMALNICEWEDTISTATQTANVVMISTETQTLDLKKKNL